MWQKLYQGKFSKFYHKMFRENAFDKRNETWKNLTKKWNIWHVRNSWFMTWHFFWQKNVKNFWTSNQKSKVARTYGNRSEMTKNIKFFDFENFEKNNFCHETSLNVKMTCETTANLWKKCENHVTWDLYCWQSCRGHIDKQQKPKKNWKKIEKKRHYDFHRKLFWNFDNFWRDFNPVLLFCRKRFRPK